MVAIGDLGEGASLTTKHTKHTKGKPRPDACWRTCKALLKGRPLLFGVTSLLTRWFIFLVSFSCISCISWLILLADCRLGIGGGFDRRWRGLTRMECRRHLRYSAESEEEQDPDAARFSASFAPFVPLCGNSTAGAWNHV